MGKPVSIFLNYCLMGEDLAQNVWCYLWADRPMYKKEDCENCGEQVNRHHPSWSLPQLCLQIPAVFEFLSLLPSVMTSDVETKNK